MGVLSLTASTIPEIWAEKAAPEEKPIWKWILANPVPYDKPILNTKGKLSFWEPKICLQTCESCHKPTVIKKKSYDHDINWFYPECWEEVLPIND